MMTKAQEVRMHFDRAIECWEQGNTAPLVNTIDALVQCIEEQDRQTTQLQAQLDSLSVRMTALGKHTDKLHSTVLTLSELMNTVTQHLIDLATFWKNVGKKS